MNFCPKFIWLISYMIPYYKVNKIKFNAGFFNGYGIYYCFGYYTDILLRNNEKKFYTYFIKL